MKEFRENKTGEKACYRTGFNLFIKDNYLVALYEAENSTFNSYSDKYNDDLWKGDVCEIFIDVGEKDHYYEIEVAPNNAVFLAYIYNNGTSTQCDYIEENFLTTEVTKKDNNYYVEIMIPLDKIHYNKDYGIMYNAFRIDTDGEVMNKHLFALNPTMCGSFHKKEYFIKFEE